MSVNVREMKPEEVVIVEDYFNRATAEYLETLGVDPTRVRERRGKMVESYVRECSEPLDKRSYFYAIWLAHGAPIGFSSVGRIIIGKEAYMHLHIFDQTHRKNGYGTACVRESTKLYFELFGLERIFCEPSAFNVAPNRTLQRAGFKYVKTHMTVPSPINYHQAVTRWVLERSG